MFRSLKDYQIQYDSQYAKGKYDAENGMPYLIDCDKGYNDGYLDVIMKQNNFVDRIEAMRYVINTSKNYQ